MIVRRRRTHFFEQFASFAWSPSWNWCCVVFVCCSEEKAALWSATLASTPQLSRVGSLSSVWSSLVLALKSFPRFRLCERFPHSWTTWNDNKSYFKWRFLSTLIGDRKQRLINLSNGDRLHLKHLFSVVNDFLFSFDFVCLNWDCVIRTLVKLFVNTFCSL